VPDQTYNDKIYSALGCWSNLSADQPSRACMTLQLLGVLLRDISVCSEAQLRGICMIASSAGGHWW